MNNIQVSGTIAEQPVPFHDGTAIRFHVRARHPPEVPGLPPRMVNVPCRVFDPSPEHRNLLLGGKHRNVRVEAAGRLERIASKGPGRGNGRWNRRRHGGLEVIVNELELFPRREA